MKYVFVLLLIFGVLQASSAQACWRSGELSRVNNKQMDTTFPDLDVVFIGTLIEVKDHKEYIFKIEKGIKGAEDGKNYVAHQLPGQSYCEFEIVGGLYFYTHRPAREAPPIPPIPKEFFDRFTQLTAPEEVQKNWEWKWNAPFREGQGGSLIRAGGRYYPSDAAFIKEKFGYDITVGADKPEKEKSE